MRPAASSRVAGEVSPVEKSGADAPRGKWPILVSINKIHPPESSFSYSNNKSKLMSRQDMLNNPEAFVTLDFGFALDLFHLCLSCAFNDSTCEPQTLAKIFLGQVSRYDGGGRYRPRVYCRETPVFQSISRRDDHFLQVAHRTPGRVTHRCVTVTQTAFTAATLSARSPCPNSSPSRPTSCLCKSSFS